MSFKDYSVDIFTSELASAAPVPGGGGAAALMGSLAAALGSMAGSISVSKKKQESERKKLEELYAAFSELRLQFLAAIDLDAEAFYPLSKAYSISKDNPARNNLLTEASVAAASAPLNALKLCCRTVELLEQLYPLCSKMLISDVACAAACCSASIRCCLLNVLVNTHSLENCIAAHLEAEASALSNEYLPRADSLFDALRTLY